MTNQAIVVNIAERSKLNIDDDNLKQTYEITPRDRLTANFPDGIHLVGIGRKVLVLENIAASSRFTTELAEDSLYVSKKSGLDKKLIGSKRVVIPPGTQIILPATTVLLDLKDDGTVEASNPDAADLAVVYLGSIDAPPGVPFVELCKPMIKRHNKIITVDAKGFINVIADGKLTQTLFLKVCIGSDVKICPNGRYIYVEDASALHDLETRQTMRLKDVNHFCFSADGLKIAYCEAHSCADIHVMDIASREFKRVTNSLKHPIQIEFYSDEKYVVLAGRKQIRIIEIQTGLIWKYMKIYGFRFLVSPSGLICIRTSDKIQIWNPLKKYFNLKSLTTNAHMWSISGKFLALSHQGRFCHDDRVHICDVSTRKNLFSFRPANKLMGVWREDCGGDSSVIFSPARDLMMATRGTQSDIVAASNGSSISTLNHRNPIIAAHWSS